MVEKIVSLEDDVDITSITPDQVDAIYSDIFRFIVQTMAESRMTARPGFAIMSFSANEDGSGDGQIKGVYSRDDLEYFRDMIQEEIESFDAEGKSHDYH